MVLDSEYRPESRYRRGLDEPAGRIFSSGQQALVRMLLAQAAADRAAGVKTAGFVSGYRGSPLGGVDQELWRAKSELEKADIHFRPAINEDLAATTLIGTQRVETDSARLYDGVFGLWYGKGPGVDRSGDALRHGNAYGSSPHGGVLVVTGDDHGCVSSSMSHQSDRVLMAWGLPVIHPTGISDYERCGLWGWALSRCSGLWVGFKAVTETVEASVSFDAETPAHYTFPEVDPGPDGLHWRWPDLPGMQIERRFAYNMQAARAFIAQNPLDTAVTAPEHPRLVIAAVGKAYPDVREALERGGVSLDELGRAGIALLAIRVVYPLSPVLEAWAKRAEMVLVIEEKAPVVEEQLKQGVFNARGAAATILGKTDERGEPLLSPHEELRPSRIAAVLEARLAAVNVHLRIPDYWRDAPAARTAQWVKRTPYLCSGCPHNTSTRVPDGSQARLGIGCHAMAARMPERATSGSVQMGGEGVDWLGQRPFVATKHIFQNIGDGTFFHSGCLAIRQAISAGANITYKVLYNDAVAMTGGQPVDGKLTVRQVVELVRSEGAREVVVVTEDPARYHDPASLPEGVTVHHRDELDTVQERLRELGGVSVLVFDQVCATELRRRRKREASAAQVTTRVIINESVCEGCGDCQVKSNCLSVVAVETGLGRKRAIDPHSCNVDSSCLKGHCPSFVTVSGTLRERGPMMPAAAEALARAAALAPPEIRTPKEPYEILVTGVGGTGVVTMAAAVGLAAHLEGLAVSVLDFTGFAQKGGSVLSHIRIAASGQRLHQHRIDRGCADVLIAADLVVASDDDALLALRREATRIIANTSETQTGAMLHDPELRIERAAIEELLRAHAGAERYDAIDAKRLAARLVGPIQTNMLLLGYAWQRGAVPVSLDALLRAIDLHGGGAKANRVAFAWGRLWAGDPAFVARHAGDEAGGLVPGETLDAVVADRSRFLAAYQNGRYAARYRSLVERVKTAAASLGDSSLAMAVARNLFKLMAFKDEYEVARLHTSESFLKGLREPFAQRPKLTFHLAPPMLDRLRKRPGGKIALSGWWILPLLRLLALLRFLRQTRLDPFALLEERREERRLLRDYERTLLTLLPKLTQDTLTSFVAWATLPETIRGYGYVKARAIEAARRRQEELAHRILSGQPERAALLIPALPALPARKRSLPVLQGTMQAE